MSCLYGFFYKKKLYLIHGEKDNFGDNLLEEVQEAILKGTIHSWKFLLENIREIQEDEEMISECYDSECCDPESFYDVYKTCQKSFIKILELGFILNEKSYIEDSRVRNIYILNLDVSTFEVYNQGTLCFNLKF
jgi:hypothetical protein